MLGATSPIPNREEGGQTALEADGSQDARASEVEGEPQDHKGVTQVKGIVKEKLPDLEVSSCRFVPSHNVHPIPPAPVDTIVPFSEFNLSPY